jgi:2-polyprenyl-3-methyl-5-hydroxy-6-metoxy-1,4-benzoquinol methylase
MVPFIAHLRIPIAPHHHLMKNVSVSTHAQEIKSHERFDFGNNWRVFIETIHEGQIATAEKSLQKMLQTDSLQGKSFVDVGSGSGLFSLAARRLGATVHSFDFDPNSVACTAMLRQQYFRGDAAWTIDEASALDSQYVDSIGRFDVVYSWGVLHHTGQMWKALEHVQRLVAPQGRLFIAIYNDQGSRSRRWLIIKPT